MLVACIFFFGNVLHACCLYIFLKCFACLLLGNVLHACCLYIFWKCFACLLLVYFLEMFCMLVACIFYVHCN